VSTVVDMIERGWDNFLARPNGTLSLRLILQPTMAALLALRAGIQDAKEGRQGYLWSILSNPERRLQLLHEGWRGARTPFLAAIVLDCVYQTLPFDSSIPCFDPEQTFDCAGMNATGCPNADILHRGARHAQCTRGCSPARLRCRN